MDKSTLTNCNINVYRIDHTTFVNTSFIFLRTVYKTFLREKLFCKHLIHFFTGCLQNIFGTKNHSVYDPRIFSRAVHGVIFGEKLFEILHYAALDSARAPKPRDGSRACRGTVPELVEGSSSLKRPHATEQLSDCNMRTQ